MGITHFQRSLSHSHTISISQSLVCIYLKTDSICYDVRFIRKQQRKSKKKTTTTTTTRAHRSTTIQLLLIWCSQFHLHSIPCLTLKSCTGFLCVRLWTIYANVQIVSNRVSRAYRNEICVASNASERMKWRYWS